MKWWRGRQPEDLVANAVVEIQERAHAAEVERVIHMTEEQLQGISWWPDESSIASSGGWCAPSETIYSLYSLPDVTVRRGGVRHD